MSNDCQLFGMKILLVRARAPLGVGEICALCEGKDPTVRERQLPRATYDRTMWLRHRFKEGEYDCETIVDVREVARQCRLELEEEITNSPVAFADVFGTFLFKQPGCVVGAGDYKSEDEYDWLQIKMRKDPRPYLPCVSGGILAFLVVVWSPLEQFRIGAKAYKVEIDLPELSHRHELVSEWTSVGPD